jgi:hypothetical protein
MGQREKSWFRSAIVVGAAAVVVGCGANVGTGDEDFVPVPLEAEREMQRLLGFRSGAKSSTLFVNFDGAEVRKGFGFNESFIPCVPVATIPPFGADRATRRAILAQVQAHFDHVAASVQVTEVRPTPGVYTTIHVGGTYSGSLGCSGSPYGIAPMPRTGSVGWVGFVFAGATDSQTVVSQAIAHEAGHTFSLQHMAAQSDVMYPTVSRATTRFMAGNIFGGTQWQDSPAILRAVLGTAASSPCVGSELRTGGGLRPGQSLCSTSGRFWATLQNDGNFVVTDRHANRPVWSSATNSGAQLVQQGDCHLVLYSTSGAAWWTGTHGRGNGCWTVMQDDGNLVTYRGGDGRALWSTWTGLLAL